MWQSKRTIRSFKGGFTSTWVVFENLVGEAGLRPCICQLRQPLYMATNKDRLQELGVALEDMNIPPKYWQSACSSTTKSHTELVQAIKLEDQPHIKTHHRMAYALRDLGRFKEANDVSSMKDPC